MPVQTVESDGYRVTANAESPEALSASLVEPAAEPAPETQPTETTPAQPTQPAEQPDADIDEDDDPAAQTVDPASDAGKALAKKKKSLRARIDELTFEKHASRREAEQAKAEAADLRQKLADLERGKVQPAAKPQDTGRPTLKAFVERIGTDFESYEDAVDAHAEALADYKLAAERQASSAEQHTRAYQTALHQSYTRGTEKYADYGAMIQRANQENRPFTPAMLAAIAELPEGHDLAYAIAKEPETYQLLVSAPTVRMFDLQLGRVLNRLERAPSGSPPAAAPVSKAKPPYQPVGSSPVASDTDLDEQPFGPAYLAALKRKDRGK